MDISFLLDPNLTPTLASLDDITLSEKGKKDLELDFIPHGSRFIAALRRIAFVMVSSSVAFAPSASIAWRELRLWMAGGCCRGGTTDLGDGGGEAAAEDALEDISDAADEHGDDEHSLLHNNVCLLDTAIANQHDKHVWDEVCTKLKSHSGGSHYKLVK
jgi:hypothetical protein